jgi:phage-related protein
MSVSIDAYKVTYSTTLSPKIRTKEAAFGQGYRQIVEDGFNSKEESWNMDFRGLDTTSVVILEAILLNSVKSTSQFISWTPPGETTAKTYTAHDILRSPMGPDIYKLQCTLRREYIL